MTDFVHLHCHSEYSLLDGLCRLKPLTQKVKELGMPAIALTDHGIMFGAMEFYRAANDNGIKPIIGCELYVARRDMRDKDPEADKRSHHLVVLAENLTGYKNLLQIASAAQLEGFYYKPRVDHAYLAQHAEGLICLSACKSGEVIRAIEAGQEDESRKLAAWHKEVFGPGNYFMELQYREGLPEMEAINKELLGIARELDIPVVATNDVHYILPEDAATQELLLAIQTGSTLSDPKRMRMGGSDYYVRAPTEMARLFSGLPQALQNTLLIAERCNLNLDNKGYHLPIFDVPAGHTDDSFLRELAEVGFARRYPNPSPELRERLDDELRIIHEMGFNTYFLIVWDLVRYAQESGIWYNIRGSAAGSMVSYTLGITALDPVKHKLIFERFLNPGRVTMPDIDMDFPDDRRGEMIEYAVRKYGKDRVAQIITFGTLGAKAAIRDVARATGVELSEADRLARLVPGGPKIHLADQLKEGELATLYKNDPAVRELLDRALSLEGISRHASTHAAGVVITDKPLTEYVPLHRATKQSNEAGTLGIVTQYPMEDLEDAGLLKMDFLGLSTLTIMRRAVDLIAATRGENVDIDQVPLDDPAIYELLSSGNVEGVFQVESAGMRKVLTGLRPTQFEDVGAVIALYRPGPMQFIDSFIARKHGREPITYRHAALEPIMRDTYGALIYQEQIIQIMTDLAGYSPGDADLVRRCVSEDTLILDAATGLRIKVKDVQPGMSILTLGDDYQFHRAKVAEKYENGVKPIYLVRTKSGRGIELTAEHPLLTVSGWKHLCDLKVGDAIATPMVLPCFGTEKPDLNEVKVIAYLLGDGQCVDRNGFPVARFYNSNTAILNDYATSVRALGAEIRFYGHSTTPTKTVTTHRPGGISPILELVKRHRLGKLAAAKMIPDAVYGYNREAQQLFLGTLWNTDGSVEHNRVSYASSSRHLIDDVAHLLRRFGVNAAWRERPTTHQIGYELTIGDQADIQRFADSFVHILLEPKRSRLLELIARTSQRAQNQSRHQVPTDVLRLVHQAKAESALSWDAAGQKVGIKGNVLSSGLNFRQPGRALSRRRLRILAEAFQSETLTNLAESQVLWDPIVEITSLGSKAVYDLAVPLFCNFVANDIVVHNSVGKKKEEELKKHRGSFIEGAQKVRGIPAQVAEAIWSDIEYFANYGFNKAHSADYALVTCQTAWLKAHYPVEYMTALLSVARGDTDKIAAYAGECARLKLEVLPPRLNISHQDFAVERMAKSEARPDDSSPSAGEAERTNREAPLAIRFGLGAIKNVGDGIVSLIVAERRAKGSFKSLEDFCERVDLRQVNKRALECMVKCGVFEEFGKRAQIMAVVDRMLESSQRAHHAQAVGQLDLFGGSMGMGGLSFSPLPAAEERPLKEVLSWEKELTGIYLSEHPLKRIMPYVERNATATIGQIDANMNGQMIIMAGMVVSARTILTKKGDTMVFAQLEDLHGTIEVTVFPRLYARTTELWQADTAVVLRAKVEERDGKMKLLAESAEPLPQDTTTESVTSGAEVASVLAAAPMLVKSGDGYAKQKKIVHYHMFITVPRSGDHALDITRVGQVYELLQSCPGEDHFSIYTTNSAGRILLDFPNVTTKHSVQLQQKLTQILGVGTVKIKSIEEAA